MQEPCECGGLAKEWSFLFWLIDALDGLISLLFLLKLVLSSFNFEQLVRFNSIRSASGKVDSLLWLE
jgi:hypothetical protein